MAEYDMWGNPINPLVQYMPAHEQRPCPKCLLNGCSTVKDGTREGSTIVRHNPSKCVCTVCKKRGANDWVTWTAGRFAADCWSCGKKTHGTSKRCFECYLEFHDEQCGCALWADAIFGRVVDALAGMKDG